MSIRHIFYRMVTQNLVEKSDRVLSAAPEGDSRYAARLGLALPLDRRLKSSGALEQWIRWRGELRGSREPASTGRRLLGEHRTPSLKCGANLGHWPVSWARYAREYVVPLFPSGGFSSLSFLYQAAAHIQESERANAVILYVGDYDEAGVLIRPERFEKDLRGFLVDWPGELRFERLAVNDDQIDSMGLPTRPPKPSDTRSPEVRRAVEAEAIPAPAMREIVASSLQGLIPERVLTVEKLVEERERADIYSSLITLA